MSIVGGLGSVMGPCINEVKKAFVLDCLEFILLGAGEEGVDREVVGNSGEDVGFVEEGAGAVT